MKSTLDKVQEIKNHGYHLDLGEVISQTFDNYKKIALLAGGVILLLMIVFGVAIAGIGGIFGLALNFTDFLTEYSVGHFSAAILLINLAVSVIGYALIVAPITAGIIQMAHNAENNNDFDFSTAFSHYKTKHFKHLFLSAAIITFTSSGIGTLIQLSNLYFFDVFLTTILGIISFFVSVLVPIFTLLTIPFIIFGNLDAMSAIKASITTVSKRFWLILLLMIIFIICSMLGIFALCIGIFFTLPIYLSAQYIIYRNAVPMEEKDELDEIGTSEY
ncbi:MAG: hypothetical protein EOO46_03580 [Flavobacterium sp.]|nr:MAG: hypothetical protein EOO46_03580 [Flavobacterium sp.]